MPGRARRVSGWRITLLALGACGSPNASVDAQPGDATTEAWRTLPALPEAISNNAVAGVDTPNGCALVSATGIDATRSQAGIHTRAYLLTPGASAWTALPDAPGPARIAASAVTLRGRVHLVGGYQVAANGNETSVTEHNVLDVSTQTWASAAPLPIATDDAMVVAWRDRYLVVISGWSTTAPIRAVQLYDVETNTWAAATEFAGTPTFGGSAAIVGDDVIAIDGVAVVGNRFSLVNQTWRARLDPASPTTINWVDGGAHAGPARYRAAPGALPKAMLFVGGTDTPYNYDGLRYDDGTPARPIAAPLALHLDGTEAVSFPAPPSPSMDHRALAACADQLVIIGGMTEGPAVSSTVVAHPVP